MTKLVDLHCHILPYVDDGALRTEESEVLLDMLFRQGVRVLCATPHLRKGMFETSDEEIRTQFSELQKLVLEKGYPMRLFLSREYHCDALFRERLQAGRVLPMGEGNSLLIEFSHLHSYDAMRAWVSEARDLGYRPLIAHAERYPALAGSPERVSALIDLGARIQINAGSVLRREGFHQASWSRRLLKEALVHVVASDSHDPIDRPPELEACAAYLRKKVGESYMQALLRDNPIEILTTKTT